MASLFEQTRRVVLKVGTGTLTSGVGQRDDTALRSLAAQVAALRARGLEVVVVSSGAIGLGMGTLGLTKRPLDLPTLQACAAIGQPRLMTAWEAVLAEHGLRCAQLLLTREDVRGRDRHLNLRACCERLLALGVVPVVNENDSVSVDEIKFGDNDLLSALVAVLCRADLLLILSTIHGLCHDAGKGPLIPLVEQITPEIEALAGGTVSTTAVGGMKSKITAAKVATAAGCGVFIGSGQDPTLMAALLAGEPRGTFFVPQRTSLKARQKWMAWFAKPAGSLRIDAGAHAALHDGKSLLVSGLTAVSDDFAANSVVDVVDPSGRVVARGLTLYSAEELVRALGQSLPTLRQLFPGRKRYEAIHRDSLVLLG